MRVLLTLAQAFKFPSSHPPRATKPSRTAVQNHPNPFSLIKSHFFFYPAFVDPRAESDIDHYRPVRAGLGEFQAVLHLSANALKSCQLRIGDVDA